MTPQALSKAPHHRSEDPRRTSSTDSRWVSFTSCSIAAKLVCEEWAPTHAGCAAGLFTQLQSTGVTVLALLRFRADCLLLQGQALTMQDRLSSELSLSPNGGIAAAVPRSAPGGQHESSASLTSDPQPTFLCPVRAINALQQPRQELWPSRQMMPWCRLSHSFHPKVSAHLWAIQAFRTGRCAARSCTKQ